MNTITCYYTGVFALKIIYIGGCFLPWLTLLCVTGLCGIPDAVLNKPGRLEEPGLWLSRQS